MIENCTVAVPQLNSHNPALLATRTQSIKTVHVVWRDTGIARSLSALFHLTRATITYFPINNPSPQSISISAQPPPAQPSKHLQLICLRHANQTRTQKNLGHGRRRGRCGRFDAKFMLPCLHLRPHQLRRTVGGGPMAAGCDLTQSFINYRCQVVRHRTNDDDDEDDGSICVCVCAKIRSMD